MDRAVVILVVLAVILVPMGLAMHGCGAKVGSGLEYRMRTKANIQEANATQRRAFRAETHAAWMRVLPVFAAAVVIAASVGVLAIGLVGARTAHGVGQAMVHRAHLYARTVQLEKSTRQFPLLTSVDQAGTWWVHNPNTGETLRLITERPANPQLVAAAGLTQASGAIAQEAARSEDSAGVAMVNPPVVVNHEEPSPPQ